MSKMDSPTTSNLSPPQGCLSTGQLSSSSPVIINQDADSEAAKKNEESINEEMYRMRATNVSNLQTASTGEICSEKGSKLSPQEEDSGVSEMAGGEDCGSSVSSSSISTISSSFLLRSFSSSQSQPKSGEESRNMGGGTESYETNATHTTVKPEGQANKENQIPKKQNHSLLRSQLSGSLRKGVTFAPSTGRSHDQLAGNTASSRQFLVDRVDTNKSFPELLETIAQLRDELSESRVEFTSERAQRKKNQKNLVKLAKQLNTTRDGVKERDEQILKLVSNQANLETRYDSLKQRYDDVVARSEQDGRDFHNQITSYQSQLRDACGQADERVTDLRRQLLESNLEVDRLRVKVAKMEMANNPDVADKIVRDVLVQSISASSKQRKMPHPRSNDAIVETEKLGVQWFIVMVFVFILGQSVGNFFSR